MSLLRSSDRPRPSTLRLRSRTSALAGVLTATLGLGLAAAPQLAQAAAPTMQSSSAPVVSAKGGVALVGQTLLSGRSLKNHGIRLVLTRGGNLKLLSPKGQLLWTSNTPGHDRARAQMQADGNFVLRTRTGQAYWSTRTSTQGSRLIVLKSAVVAVQAKSGKLMWSAGSVAASAPPSTTPQGFAINELAAYGWTTSQWPCLQSLWQKESGWNYRAENPSSGAYGIPQSLPGSKMASAGSDWRTNADTQIKWGMSYIAAQYGDPCGAWGHSQSTGWY